MADSEIPPPQRTAADAQLGDFIEPGYGDRTLGDVLPAVSTALGVDAGLGPSGIAVPPAPAYVVFLVDGLGQELITEHPDDAPLLNELVAANVVEATAGFPSTTATSLTSLGTALPPGEHGIVGFTSRVPGTDRLLNALYWDERVDPHTWQPHQTAFARLAHAGVHTSVVAKSAFAGSGLTRAAQRGAEYVGADDLAQRVSAAVSASSRRPSLTYVYDSELDATGHAHGVDSYQWRGVLADVDEQVERLREALDPDVRLLVVADHGMVDATEESKVDIDQLPALREGIFLLGGEARVRHLYTAAGAAADVAATWHEVLGDRALVLTRDEAIARGWFGSVAAGVRPRLGDVVVAARDNYALMSSVDFSFEMSLIGLHGSLTSREMRIPLLVC